jgi:TRAP-type C4-dicarboxylate transport system permease small subunit
MVTNETPEAKRLGHTSFVIHATRGVIRDQTVRRRLMLVLLGIALAFIVSGSTVLQPVLDPHQHPARFIVFWLICAWFTISALLLALFDVLTLRTNRRQAERELRDDLERRSSNH